MSIMYHRLRRSDFLYTLKLIEIVSGEKNRHIVTKNNRMSHCNGCSASIKKGTRKQYEILITADGHIMTELYTEPNL